MKTMIARICCWLLVLALASCDWIVPSDAADACSRRLSPLVDEFAIVRVNRWYLESEQRLYLDRLKYLSVADSMHSANRVVIAVTPPTAEVRAIEVGDTVRVTTNFIRLAGEDGGGYEAFIPDWSPKEGPCGEGIPLHRVVAIAPAASATAPQ